MQTPLPSKLQPLSMKKWLTLPPWVDNANLLWGITALGMWVPAGDPSRGGTAEEAVVKQLCHLGKQNGSGIWTIKNAIMVFSESCFPSLF